MKITVNIAQRLILILSILWWVGVGAVMLNDAIAPFGHLTLTWRNPQRPSAVYSWNLSAAEFRRWQDVGMNLQPAQTYRFAVTLPRGFQQGTVDVRTARPIGIRVSGDLRPGVSGQSAAGDGRAFLRVLWADLQARGHTFVFLVTNTSNTPARVSRVIITAQR